MTQYVDTSILAAYYCPEPLSERAEQRLRELRPPTISWLTDVELHSALAGVTRDAIMTLANEAGYEVRERRITRDEVYVCDEAFFTGTAAEVTPIRELDGRVIGEGKRGPITTDIQSRFFALVEGRADAHHEWLTPVA